jgi:alkanesulfonate monooxygenase SsuD/methylene tetrahydromethanopterin reductase-like flavin-dependent oxidoreductase (luciferase family)
VDLAAKHADLVYAALLSKPAAHRYREQLREGAVRHGREPGSIRLLPGLVPVIGCNRQEALRRHEALHAAPGEAQLIADFVARAGLSGRRVDPDEVLDPAWFAWTEDQSAPVGFTRAFTDLAANEQVTPRQAVRRYEGGHRLVVGTPEEVAEDILGWWRDGTVDGFTLQPPVLPDDLERFVRLVVPLLREAGALPDHYEHATIRDRFGLAVPRPAPLTVSRLAV